MSTILTVLAILAAIVIIAIICGFLGIWLVVNYLCGDFWKDLTNGKHRK